jgi:hypothetical protein
VGKGGRCVRLTSLPPSCAVVMKSGNLKFLEPSGPLQACNGAALPFFLLICNGLKLTEMKHEMQEIILLRPREVFDLAPNSNRVQSHANPSGICERSGNVSRFSSSIPICPCQRDFTNAHYTFMHLIQTLILYFLINVPGNV